jgi:hypothetical protein
MKDVLGENSIIQLKIESRENAALKELCFRTDLSICNGGNEKEVLTPLLRNIATPI